MAIAITNKTSAQDTTNASSYATASVDFIGGRLYLIGVASHATGARSFTLSGGSLNWTSLTNTEINTIAAPTKRVSGFYVAPAGNVTTAVTIDFSGSTQQHCLWSIEEVTGSASSFGTAGSNRADSGSSGTITLGTFQDANSAGWGFFCRAENQDMTEGSGFTKLSEVTGGESPTTSILSEYQINDNTVDCSWASSGAWGGVAVEIKAAGSGGGTADVFGMMGFFGA